MLNAVAKKVAWLKHLFFFVFFFSLAPVVVLVVGGVAAGFPRSTI